MATSYRPWAGRGSTEHWMPAEELAVSDDRIRG